MSKIKAGNVNFDDILSTGGGNFVAQEVLKQCNEIQQLNPSSLNCFRVTSIYLNGKFDYAVALKIGKKGAFRDNWNNSYWVNVSKNGVLSEYGYDYNMNAIDRSDLGIVFKDRIIPHYQDMIAYLEKTHKTLFANCGVIGWDVTIDSNYSIRVIETNLYNPGTNIEQFVSGDFFKPFRDDLINAQK